MAMRVDEGEQVSTYWFHTDHLGSTSLLSDAAGEPAAGSQVRYLPYGEYRTTPTAGLTDVGYTGHRQTDLGLIYMRARYYVQSVGRFLSADSIVPDFSNPQSLSRYTYVSGNPLKLIDPSGHLGQLPWGHFQELLIEEAGDLQLLCPYQYAKTQAMAYYRSHFSLPFEGDPTVTSQFGPSHPDGVDWGGQFAVSAPARGEVTRAGSDQPAGIWRIGRDPYEDEHGNTQYREIREYWRLRESERGTDGLLEPERLLLTGDWVDLAPWWSHTQGTIVNIDHGHNLQTRYYHLDIDPTIAAGVTVDQGVRIGETANTGWSTGTHLHYGVRFVFGDRSEWLNPLIGRSQ